MGNLDHENILHEKLKNENFIAQKFPDLWYFILYCPYIVCILFGMSSLHPFTSFLVQWTGKKDNLRKKKTHYVSIEIAQKFNATVHKA